MNELLVVPPAPTTAVVISTDGEKIKGQLIIRAAAVTKVESVEERDSAIVTAAKIKTHLKEVEAQRQEVLRPFHDLIKRINGVAAEHVKSLEKESKRIAGLVGTFELDQRATREMQQHNIAQEAKRLREQSLASGGQEEEGPDSVAKMFEVEEKASELTNKALEIAEAGREEKAKGGMLRQDWEITTHDLRALYMTYPQCVELKPRLLAIKDLLKVGITPPGVTAVPKAAFAVRGKA